QDFPLARLFQLATNYRSTQTIVQAATAMIAHNSAGQSLHLRAVQAAGKPIRLYTAPSELAEAIAVWRHMSGMLGGAHMVQADQHAERAANARSFSDFGVLVRTGQQAEVLEQCLLQEGLPYRLIGHTSFLEAKHVRQALAFGRYILQPTDKLRFLQVLEVEAFCPGLTTLAEVHRQGRQQTGDRDLHALAAAVPALAPQLQTLATAVERYRPLVSASPTVFLQHWQEEYRIVDDPDLERLLRLAERLTSLEDLCETILLGKEADYEY